MPSRNTGLNHQDRFRRQTPHNDSWRQAFGPVAVGVQAFGAAAAEGLHRVAHAGEEAGPQYVWQALDVLGAERIDHGIRAMEDASLIRRLRDDQTPLTVCPLSNVALRAVGSLTDHVLPAMLAEGLMATVNSDDPAYFGGCLEANFAAARSAMNLSEHQIVTLARNSFDACFATRQQREGWKAELEAMAAREPDPVGPGGCRGDAAPRLTEPRA